jgi:Mg2+ and Co2+ transporter CorA
VTGVRECDLAELPTLRERGDGFLWLDIPVRSEAADRILSDEFQPRPMAIEQSRERNHIYTLLSPRGDTPFLGAQSAVGAR